ncbi:MAG: LptE family protein, partial [Chitinivibrionia bacterium]|nr:LptE family protein [Chitinivibrionia bacterium]
FGCAYSTTSRTAKGIESISVPFFVNQTTEPNLEINVTERIIENLVNDNTLDVVDEKRADAVLEGTILGFANTPFSFNRELNAEEYHVVITVELSLFNRKLNEPLWAKRTIRGDGSYFLDSTEEGFSYDDALEEAIKEITDQILNLTVQDW